MQIYIFTNTTEEMKYKWEVSFPKCYNEYFTRFFDIGFWEERETTGFWRCVRVSVHND